MPHILVIRLSALGDVALLAPVLRQRAAANPEVHFTVAGPPLLQPLFGGMDNVSYLPLDKKRGTLHIYRALRAVPATAVADLHVVNRVGIALALMALRRWLHLDFGVHTYRLDKGRRSRRRMLSHADMTPRRPQWQRYDDVFARMGLRGGVEPVPPRTKPAGAAMRTIGVAPFAQHQGKIWPIDRTAQLVHLLAAQGHRVLLFGSKAEAALLQPMAAGSPNVQVVAGQGSFERELHTIANLDLMVSMDSANMHFASALGVPVVSIWGATHPDFGFYGYGQPRANALCANLPCQPCSAFGQRPCRYGTLRCMEAITPQMVAQCVQKALQMA